MNNKNWFWFFCPCIHQILYHNLNIKYFWVEATDTRKIHLSQILEFIKDTLGNRISLIKNLYLNFSITIKSQIIFILRIDFKKVINYEVWYRICPEWTNRKNCKAC